MKRSTVTSILVLLAASLGRCSAAQTELELFVPGTLRDLVNPDPPPYTAKACDGTLKSACTACDKIKLCVTADTANEGLNPVEACPVSTPYCSMSASPTEAVCQKTPDSAVAECAAPMFKCTGVGFFADAYSCQTYYYCSGPAATPQVYGCQKGYKFSTKVNACALSATPCPTFTCKPDLTDSIFQQLVANTQYYVYCEYDRSVTPPKYHETYVFSCGEGATYNPAMGKCEFKCPKEGLYGNSAYPNQYYQCYLNGGKLIYKDMICPATQQFDATVKRCVDAPAPPQPMP